MPATPTRAAGIDSKANMEAILQNIQSLAATARQGRLPPASRVMVSLLDVFSALSARMSEAPYTDIAVAPKVYP